MRREFRRKVADRTLNVAVIGLGYVGLPLLLRFSEMGFPVTGIDSNVARIASVAAGRSPIRHISHQAIERLIQSERTVITTDCAAVAGADAIILCLPTPLTALGAPDLSYVEACADFVIGQVRRGQLIVLQSTVYPGATEEIFIPRLLSRGMRPGEDVYLAYSPEREDPGNATFSLRNTPKVCAGLRPACSEMAALMFSQIVERVVTVSSIRTAEMSKLLENIQRSVNIGLANEMKMVADLMDIDIHEVISAASTKPFGFTPYYPGPGLGGHCIPIDPAYLAWKAKDYGAQTRLIDLAGEIHAAMPGYVVGKVVAGLKSAGRLVRSSRILVCGLAYKKNVDDIRESPALPIVAKLSELGALVSVSDAHVPDLNDAGLPFGVDNVPCSLENIERQDCVLIATDHDYFDYDLIQSRARLIVDCRGRYSRRTPNVVVA